MLNMSIKLNIIGLLGLFPLIVFGEVEPSQGLRSNPPGVWALKGANVHIEPGKIFEDAIIIVRDGMIDKVGVGISIPKARAEVKVDENESPAPVRSTGGAGSGYIGMNQPSLPS